MPVAWCEIWSFWIAIFVGLQGWFLLAYGRMVHFVYSGTPKGMLWYAGFIVSSLVLIVPNDVFGYDFDVPFCIASDRGRVALGVWVMLWSLFLLASLIKICGNARPSVEFDHVVWSCLWGFVFLVPIAALGLAFEDDVKFFQAHVTAISVLHVWVSLRTRWPGLWFAYLASSKVRSRYLADFEDTIDSKHMDYKSVFEAQYDIKVMRDYLEFVYRYSPHVVELFNRTNEVCALAEKDSPLYASAFHDGIYRPYFSGAATVTDVPVQITCTHATPVSDVRQSILIYMHKQYDRRYFGSLGKIKRFLWPCARPVSAASFLPRHDDSELGSDLDAFDSASSISGYDSFGPDFTRTTPLDSSSESSDSAVVYTEFHRIAGTPTD